MTYRDPETGELFWIENYDPEVHRPNLVPLTPEEEAALASGE